MGVLFGKFAKTEKKGKSAVKQTRSSFFRSIKTVPVHMKVAQTFSTSNEEKVLKIIDSMKSNENLEKLSHQGDSVTTLSLGQNFDEYKSYLNKSMKRKHGTANRTDQSKLRKICQKQLDLHHSLACDVLVHKIQTTPNISKRDFSENFNQLLMNGTVSLDRSPKIAPDSCIQVDHDKSLNIQNTKAKIRTCSRSPRTNNFNNKKLKNLQLMQLTSEPRVVLDQTIVFEYLKTKSIIDRIMRPDKTKTNFKGNCLVYSNWKIVGK